MTSALNILFIDGRNEAKSPEGFLKPDYDDGHQRGNIEFGRLTAREISGLI